MQKLLLLHGALGSAENFKELREMLADYEIHSLNFGGHGGNAIPEQLAIPVFGQEVLDYLDQNQIKKIHIFGYSMGGYVGLYIARNFPERVEKLMTLATKLQWTIDGAANNASLLNPEIIKQKVPKYAALLENLHGKNWEVLLHKTAEMMHQLGAHPTLGTEDFPAITIPVLIAVGDNDMMVGIEESVNAYRLLSNGQFLVLPNTPHPIEKVNISELAHQLRNYFN